MDLLKALEKFQFSHNMEVMALDNKPLDLIVNEIFKDQNGNTIRLEAMFERSRDKTRVLYPFLYKVTLYNYKEVVFTTEYMDYKAAEQVAILTMETCYRNNKLKNT